MRVPGHVVGDGVHTIEQLVDEVNRDPRRGVGHEKVLTRLLFDHQAETLLAAKGYTRETVPADGERVFLRSTGNLSTGGTATDMTDQVHPDNIEMAVRAVKAIGLDVGGVDFLSTDVTESYKEVGGAICEVNAAPGLPDAHGAERGTAARRGRAGDGHAVSAGYAEPDSDRRRHRHQRQDHHGPDAGPHPEAGRASRRADLDRRGLHRRPAHGARAT